MNWFDYLIISLICLSGFIGYYKGITNAITSFITGVFNLLISIGLSIKVSTFIFANTSIGNSISSTINRALFNNPFDSNTMQHLELLKLDLQTSAILHKLSTLSSYDLTSMSINDLFAFIIVTICVILIILVVMTVIVSLLKEFLSDLLYTNKKIKPLSFKLRLSGFLFNASISFIFIVAFLRLKILDYLIYVNEGFYKDVVGSQISNLFKQIF